MTSLLRLFAFMPLWLIHSMGSVLGWLVFLISRRYAERMKQNIRISGLFTDERAYKKLLKQVIGEAGKSVLELFVVWLRPQQKVIRLVRNCHGWEHVEAALKNGKGVIMLTPHLGCPDIAAQYYATRYPLTVLYRPSRFQWVEKLILSGRQRGQITLAPTDLKGVKGLLGALRRGEAIGILPDQVPSHGEGVWANFFGHPAYTMTLVGRLQKTTDAAVLLVFAERLPNGKGFDVRFQPLPEPLPDDKVRDASVLNTAIERLIRQCPSQYLWSYNRYKVPKGVEPPSLG